MTGSVTDLQVSALERLPFKLSTKIFFNDPQGCWLWTGNTNPLGYVRVWDINTHKIRSLHRLMYELLIKPIPHGMTIDHLCRRRNCANPLHLEVVTHRENCLRGYSLIAANARKTHCNRGHLLNVENLVKVKQPNHRKCKTCANYTRNIRRKLQRDLAVSV